MRSIPVSLLFLLLASVALMTQACGEEESKSQFVELDLLSHGMPIVIRAPADPVIESLSLLVQKDLTVKKGTDYALQIYESDALVRNPAAIKARLLYEVQGNKYYQKIISDEDQGFIYQTAIDSSNINYGFRYFRLQGDKEYVFQSALGGRFTLEAIQDMYDSVK
jgi:hypothetical protein